MNFQDTNRQGQGMYPVTGLLVPVSTISASTSTREEALGLLQVMEESFPGDPEMCKQCLQQMDIVLKSQPKFLAIHQHTLSNPEDNVTPMECDENSGPYYEDIRGIGPVVVITSEESNHFLAEDLPSQSNDCPSESNDSLDQRNELLSGPSDTTDFLIENKDSLSQRNDSLSQRNDNDDLIEDHDDFVLCDHESTLRRSDRARDKLMPSTNTNVAPKPTTRGRRRRNMSESGILSATNKSKSAIKIGIARRVSKRGRPQVKPTSNWEAIICSVANTLHLESSQKTMTTSENSGTVIEGLCGSPLLSSTLTSESSLTQPKRVDIRDLQQKRMTNSLTPISHVESEIKRDDEGKEGNPEPLILVAGTANIKSGVGCGRKKKNLNLLQMLSMRKKKIPVQGRPKQQKTPGSKNTRISRANAWRQKQVKKALFTSPKIAKFNGPNDFFAKVRKSIGDTEDYRQFLRCVSMLNEKTISKNDFLTLVYPFLNNFPNLYDWLQKFIMANKTLPGFTGTPSIHTDLDSETIVVNKLSKLGKSYVVLPPNYVQPICSGRTDLCNSVLNDVYVCVPPHRRGGPNARITRKLRITNKRVDTVNTQTEDGQYQVDLMIEIGNTCITHFEIVQKKISSMSQEMLNSFQLRALLGGDSQIIPSFIVQLYGKTEGPKIIDALNKKPVDTIPVVLPRIRGKVKEWREAQKKFNKKWRDQVELAIASQIDYDVVIIE